MIVIIFLSDMLAAYRVSPVDCVLCVVRVALEVWVVVSGVRDDKVVTPCLLSSIVIGRELTNEDATTKVIVTRTRGAMLSIGAGMKLVQSYHCVSFIVHSQAEAGRVVD